MKPTPHRHYALSVCAAAAILAGCGGSASPLYQPPGIKSKHSGSKHFVRDCGA